MENTKKIALLVDVDNVKISSEAFNELYKKLNGYGELVYCKFYGYNDRKHIYLSDVITKYGYETAPFMRFKKRFSQLDSRIIVDAVALNYTKPEINTFCIVAGDGDLIPLLVELKSSGKTLIDINTPYQEQNTHMFDQHLYISAMEDDAETYKPKTTKTVKKVTKTVKVEKPKRVVKPVVEEYEDDEYEEPVFIPRKVVKPVVEPEYVEPVYQPAQSAPVQPAQPVTQTVTKTETIEEVAPEANNDDNSELSEKLNDITMRYGELDFSNNSDMDKKLKLINDIENLINEETAKGEGLNSNDADIRQVFVELQSIAEDMKSAL